MELSLAERDDRIRQSFQQEVESSFVARNIGELPHSYDTISTDWLTSILCRNTNGAVVADYSLGAPDDGTSNRRRIFLRYNAAGQAAGLPSTVFCKSSQKLVHRLQHANIGLVIGEVAFYSRYRPMFDIEAPNPIFAAYDPVSYNSIIMLEDLDERGAGFCNHETPITRGRIENQLSTLAQLHGRYYGTSEVADAKIMTLEGIFRATDRWLGLEVACDKGFAAAESVIPNRLFRRRAEVWEPTLKAVEMQNSLPLTFTHNDVHLRNWYITGEGRMGLSDWQTFARGHWGFDLAYLISCNLTVENRRLWESDLIRYYVEELREFGGPTVSFDDAFLLYRRHFLSALTWWTVTNAPPENGPEYYQPEDATLEFIGRMTTAIDDLDAMDSYD
ncbi:phosphotransferase family protein [Tardibacter chloracetimidivorans]|uniref:phosphotransferase family protein n=1 Tax=Tardibacter chloracetimidivorans TaxID=1921510 RepID=UPI0013010595|nr:phosphotransferase [Tardibacter chloracetimidivorans]